MSVFYLWQYCYTMISNKTRAFKVSFLIILLSLVIYIRVSGLTGYIDTSMSGYVIKEALENVAEDSRYAEEYRQYGRLPNLKFILIWNNKQIYGPTVQLGNGQRAFIKNNCSAINCYVTYDKRLFGDDITEFDAIAFNSLNINALSTYMLPKERSPHQKYIYFNVESPDYYPVCSSIFDGFFNWTASFKLNSDILFTYVQIRNRSGDIVGPKKNMEWAKNMSFNNDFSIVQNKSKAVAWLVSNCHARSGRDEVVTYLQKYLKRYELTVDIYGDCGPYKCPRQRINSCIKMLGRKYYFYLAFENSFAEDYVTGELLTALNHNMIPIVYGGADYSRFLPPNTYLDALQMRPKDLADTIAQLMSSPEQYNQYFSWKSQYTYSGPFTPDSVCAVCEALNNKTKMETRMVYEDLRVWWNPSYKIRCKSL